MTKSKLTALLQSVAVADDPDNTRKLIMQSMTMLMNSTARHAVGNTVEQCNLAVADEEGPRVITTSIEYVVRDPSLLSVAWQKAIAGALRLEPCRKIGADATIADGVIALLSERPVLTIVATDEDCIELQIGGFDKSAVFHAGNLMDLSRQVIDIGEAR
jgi:hypothetical protein